MSRLFFDSSRGAFALVTETFDFTAPALAALWNLRWQVIGYRSVRPAADGDELELRFVSGAGTRYGNLDGWVDTPWENTEQHLARFLLVNLCAVYEGWIANVLTAVGASSKTNEKRLQYPTQGASGVSVVVAAVRGTQGTPLIDACFRASLETHRKRATAAELEKLLVCYRFFKECRNAISHSGSTADQRVVDALAAYQMVTAHELGLRKKEVPSSGTIALGDPVTLSLRGVIGFSDIVLRLIATLDCELAQSPGAEAWVASVWLHKLGRSVRVSPFRTSRNSRLAELARSIGLPSPKNIDVLAQFLIARKLILPK